MNNWNHKKVFQGLLVLDVLSTLALYVFFYQDGEFVQWALYLVLAVQCLPILLLTVLTPDFRLNLCHLGLAIVFGVLLSAAVAMVCFLVTGNQAPFAIILNITSISYAYWGEYLEGTDEEEEKS